jgi:predicted nucleic acid-binding protein
MTLTLDSSVVVPALDGSHEAHEQVATFLAKAGDMRLIAHVALEAYHVLTRVRPYRRLPPSSVARALRSTFPGPLVGLAPEHYWELVDRAPELGIVGGAIFDAFIATTAQRAALTLVSRDRRAAATYAALGAECELLADSKE